MFLLRVSSPGPVEEDEPDMDIPAGPKEPRRSVADTRERRPRVPPEDILLGKISHFDIGLRGFSCTG